ncbi:MAG: diaminopimelate decarboxylase, partial [Chloroflexi bacterium]
QYALDTGVGWFNVENVTELKIINTLAGQRGRKARIALRLNPNVTANTHPYIATGHGGAKFGMTEEVITNILARQTEYPHVDIQGVHIHIGSQLGDAEATLQALNKALSIIQPYTNINTVNIGGGLPVAYHPDETVPDIAAFANAIAPSLTDYTVLLEPGRSIVADAGVLITRVLYTKEQGGQQFVIIDASMSDLIRPALYQAYHHIVPVHASDEDITLKQVVGPVCETADIIGRDIALPNVQEGDLLAILTAGAYGMVMASNYNARPRPAEVVVQGGVWSIARHRETWEDLVRLEVE